MVPKLIVQQKITAFTNKYEVFAAKTDGGEGEMLAFAQQKRLAFKEKVTFYKSPDKSEEVFTFRAEKTLDIHGRYFVEDSNGKLIGTFKKEFGQSLTSSTWSILGADDKPRITVTESNKTLAILRRFGAFIPFIGPIFEIVTDFLKYHFNLIDVKSGEIIGFYEKTTLFRDHYLLSMADKTDEDWRLLAAVSIALDALQSR